MIWGIILPMMAPMSPPFLAIHVLESFNSIFRQSIFALVFFCVVSWGERDNRLPKAESRTMAGCSPSVFDDRFVASPSNYVSVRVNPNLM